jgi:hypothetical protein
MLKVPVQRTFSTWAMALANSHRLSMFLRWWQRFTAIQKPCANDAQIAICLTHMPHPRTQKKYKFLGFFY